MLGEMAEKGWVVTPMSPVTAGIRPPGASVPSARSAMAPPRLPPPPCGVEYASARHFAFLPTSTEVHETPKQQTHSHLPEGRLKLTHHRQASPHQHLVISPCFCRPPPPPAAARDSDQPSCAVDHTGVFPGGPHSAVVGEPGSRIPG